MQLNDFTALFWNPDRESKKKYQNKLRLIRFKDNNPNYEKQRWAKRKDAKNEDRKKRRREDPEYRDAENKRSRDAYYKNHVARRAAAERAYYTRTDEQKERDRKSSAKYRENNRELCRERCRPHYRHNSAKRKRHIKERTPPWADLEAIKFFYECCPAGCHVDHIIPLRGKKMSGLHIAENLQWLPEKKNMSKSNTVDREIARRI